MLAWSIIGIILILAGGVTFLKPDLVCRVTEPCAIAGTAKPMAVYSTGVKMSGVLFFLIGVAAILLPLLVK